MHKQGRRASSCFLSVLIGLFVVVLVQGTPSFSAYVERPNPRPYSAIDLSDGTHPFSWYDTDNVQGTRYRVAVSEWEDDPGFTPVWNTTELIGVSKQTLAGATDGPFMIDGVNLEPIKEVEWPWGDVVRDPRGNIAPGVAYDKLVSNFNYLWRVDTQDPDTGVWQQGRVWRVYGTMAQPGADVSVSPYGAQRVGVYPRFVWDEPHFDMVFVHVNPVQEKVLLVDLDEGDPSYSKGWVTTDGGDVTGINNDRVVKTYDPGADNAIDRIREFWHFDDNWQRLLPNRNYAWRVVYCDEDGNPLFADLDDNDEKAQDGTEPYLWADRGPDVPDGGETLGWKFRTVPEVSSDFQQAIELNSPNTQSLVIYWESPYGTLARDPVENDFTWRSIAEDLENIQIGRAHV